MLQESLLWLWARCAPSARRVGHLAEAIALQARSQRQRDAWAAHQQHSRRAILNVAAQCQQRRVAVMLGSGNCLDVPVAELAEQFDQLRLVDIVQLPHARRVARRFRNVAVHELDVTGIVASVAAADGRFSVADLAALAVEEQAIAALNKIAPADTAVDFMVSVNLLSQLPVKPVEYLQQHAPLLPLDALNDFAWRLLRAHLIALRQYHCPVCLISDDLQRTWNRQQELIEQVSLLDALGLDQQVVARWQWPLAPVGELPDGCSAEHEVVALQL